MYDRTNINGLHKFNIFLLLQLHCTCIYVTPVQNIVHNGINQATGLQHVMTGATAVAALTASRVVVSFQCHHYKHKQLHMLLWSNFNVSSISAPLELSLEDKLVGHIRIVLQNKNVSSAYYD